MKNRLLITYFFVVVFAITKVYSQVPTLVTNSEGVSIADKVNNEIFFFKTIDSSSNWVQQLWTTNVSLSSAAMVKSFGILFSPIGDIKLHQGVNGKYYFVTANPNDDQLWVSDGTAGGTIPLFSCSKIYAFFDFNNQLFFSAFSSTNVNVNGIYKTDGTVGGTVLLKNLQTRYGAISYDGIHHYVKFNNKLIFTAKKGIINNPATHYMEIWSTDGTAGGFVRLDSLYGDARRYDGGNGVNMPSQYFREYNGYLYFNFINTSTASDELWRTNGTVGNSAYYSSACNPLIEYNGKLILAGGGSGIGTELLSTDGTATGPVLIKDINISSPGFLGSKPANFHSNCGKLFFVAVDSGQTDSRIWVTDGTTNGTTVYTLPRGYYDPLTVESNGIFYYAYMDNNLDSAKVFMVDSVTCNSTKILSWKYSEYGGVMRIIQLNPLFLILSGGGAGVQALYAYGAVTSVKENTNKKLQVVFYPNPATDRLHLKREFNRVVITNILGEAVYESNSKTTEIPLESIADGIYTISLFSKDFNDIQKLIIKR